MATFSADISAQEESHTYVTRWINALGGCCWEVGEEDPTTVSVRVTREMNVYVTVGFQKFILMIMFFMLHAVCWSAKHPDPF